MTTAPPPVTRVISREAWGALPVPEEVSVENMETPVGHVVFTYSTDTPPCKDLETCSQTVRDIQKRHLDQGLQDISYNFLVGGDLNIYEGRGWKRKPERHEKFPDLHGSSIEIAFVGDYSVENYPLIMGTRASEFVNRGIYQNLVSVRHEVEECGKELDLDEMFQGWEIEKEIEMASKAV